MKNIPNKIWLQLDGDMLDGVDISDLDFEELEEVTWCDTHQNDQDILYHNSKTIKDWAEEQKAKYELNSTTDSLGYVKAMNDLMNKFKQQ